ncbi:MarR family winged helix-turn-helix transcriptional regulator [Leucobacter chromiiresistens]|uniref:Transcriptional regulator n=1 Tax=Leucobacter chromiiresistens TaxID=1079994 RepID=A0A147ENZ8_9MICO|nr:MarR family transcriptional regulator [Leucobacter chromiiresistens]KTR86189.1 transcriptional regulator [Leucobacter chromiiresistens]
MSRRVADIEYEQMLLSRYTTAQHRLEGDLERSAYLLLSRLEHQGPMTIAQLRDAFLLDTSTVQRQTAAAMREGLLERIPDPDGGQAKKFEITARGTERLTKVRQRFVATLDRALEAWSDADVAHFADLLRRFNLDIERYGESRGGTTTSWPRTAAPLAD